MEKNINSKIKNQFQVRRNWISCDKLFIVSFIFFDTLRKTIKLPMNKGMPNTYKLNHC